MSNLSPAFAFPNSPEPLVLTAARSLAARLDVGEVITRPIINSVLTEQFGGSDADARWSVRDAHAALELAQVLWLQGNSKLSPSSPPETAKGAFDRLEAQLPSQTVRSEEQIELQQFATPPYLAWLAARACAFGASEVALEPSAGTGMLAVWAESAGARLALNEISPLRRECLASLFPQATLSGHDGELIDELLDPNISPGVVLMNPPYSHGVERGADGRTGARHLRSAWKRLVTGGRLVAVMPEWFDIRRFVSGTAGPIALRLNAAIERAFVRSGTSITTRLLVLDKTLPSNDPVAVNTNEFSELCDLIDGLPPRETARFPAAVPASPRGALLGLVAGGNRLRPVPPARTGVSTDIVPCRFEALAEPAPIAEQVGHYLPYRPSRILIPDAADHPTPLVESVAMGSITAPIPTQVPRLPSGLMANGLLSAAQAETLIYAANAHARDLPGRFVPQDNGCILKPSAEGHAYRMGSPYATLARWLIAHPDAPSCKILQKRRIACSWGFYAFGS
jgi:hypothetical protein